MEIIATKIEILVIYIKKDSDVTFSRFYVHLSK